MNITTVNNALMLIRRISEPKKSTLPVVPFSPQKPLLDILPSAHPLFRSTPEEQGVSSALIADFLFELNADQNLDMHTVTVIRNGIIINETEFGAYNIDTRVQVYSASKSVTSLAIGMLIDEGKLTLDTKVAELFGETVPPLNRFRMRELTVRHLLTMTSTVLFNEAGAVTETEWVKCFFNSALSGKLGETFSYNSMNTYILSAVVKSVSGKGLMDYLNPKLFAPLGIEDAYWEKSPEDIEKGGWGLYIRPEDIGKIGVLLLNKGVWKGKRLISEEYLDKACSAQIVTPADCGDYDYGFQIWCHRSGSGYLFNGMFGQNVRVFPQNNIVIVTTAGNDELLQQGSYYPIVEKYFANTLSCPKGDGNSDYKKLIRLNKGLKAFYSKRNILRFLGIKRRKSLKPPNEIQDYCKKEFFASAPEAASAGILPLTIQVLQSNYTPGLSFVSFDVIDRNLYFIYGEKDTTYRLPVGLNGGIISEIKSHGECFKAAVTGRFYKNENSELELRLRISFLETPFSRYIKVVFHNGSVILSQTEKPGEEFVLSNSVFLLGDLKNRLNISGGISDNDFFKTTVHKCFALENCEMKTEH